ncbi:hypothetical protein E2C01_064396 [Portunus trituberculatus]|uniref:Uncharacterized protein n=1 Tax=Portunus trituberculatus TaxID=210409 RepID=A0A5B7HLP2_PORTR|nr:hypothetical protein [Portunus trituberculatus]
MLGKVTAFRATNCWSLRRKTVDGAPPRRRAGAGAEVLRRRAHSNSLPNALHI